MKNEHLTPIIFVVTDALPSIHMERRVLNYDFLLQLVGIRKSGDRSSLSLQRAVACRIQ